MPEVTAWAGVARPRRRASVARSGRRVNTVDNTGVASAPVGEYACHSGPSAPDQLSFEVSRRMRAADSVDLALPRAGRCAGLPWPIAANRMLAGWKWK